MVVSRGGNVSSGARQCNTTHQPQANSFNTGAVVTGDAETLQQTELVDLAFDCGLASDAFPMARVEEVLMEATRDALEISHF